MRTLHLVVAALLVLLAGCAAFAPGTPTATDDSPTETRAGPDTPAETATPTPTPTGAELAPGVTRDGIVNPVALQSAHRRALLAGGFVANVSYENVAGDTVQWRTTQYIVAGPGAERVLQHTTAGDGRTLQTEQDIWTNTTHTTRRQLLDGDTEYTVRERLTTPESLVIPGPIIRPIQTSADQYRVDAVEQRNGTRFVTLTTSPGPDAGNRTAETTSTIVVDERGVIHAVESTTNYGGGEDWRVTYTVEQVGGVDPQPPAWLGEVPASAGLAVDLFTDMGPEGVLTIEHVGGGDAVPAGTFVTIFQNESLLEARLDEPLRPGETLYVSVDAGTGALRVDAEPPETGTYEPLAHEFTVRVFTGDGTTLLEESLGWASEPRSDSDGR